MRSLILALVAAGQLTIAVHPALAAELEPGEQSRMGMFGGVQVRLPIGGSSAERPRAGLAIAPMMRSQRIGGESASRIGQGLELNLSTRQPELRFAGTRLDRLGIAPGGRAPDGSSRAGVSTLGWVGIGAGAIVLALGGFALWLKEATDCDYDGDDCT